MIEEENGIEERPKGVDNPFLAQVVERGTFSEFQEAVNGEDWTEARRMLSYPREASGERTSMWDVGVSPSRMVTEFFGEPDKVNDPRVKDLIEGVGAASKDFSEALEAEQRNIGIPEAQPQAFKKIERSYGAFLDKFEESIPPGPVNDYIKKNLESIEFTLSHPDSIHESRRKGMVAYLEAKKNHLLAAQERLRARQS